MELPCARLLASHKRRQGHLEEVATLLSDHEQRVLDELERHYATEALDPHRPGRRGRSVLVLAITACLVFVALVSTGAALAGSAIALATGLAWLLWHYWPQLIDAAAATSAVEAGHAEPGERHRADGLPSQ
jgi:ferric-dicitrate binding protein FerR (iron transport regulator)